MKIEDIMKEMQRRVLDNEPIDATSWLESALRVNTLLSTKDNELACYEAELASNEALLVEQGEPAAKAKILARNKIDYKEYLILKGELKRIDEYIKLAKKRAVINEI